jgi:hypothetical protein
LCSSIIDLFSSVFEDGVLACVLSGFDVAAAVIYVQKSQTFVLFI